MVGIVKDTVPLMRTLPAQEVRMGADGTVQVITTQPGKIVQLLIRGLDLTESPERRFVEQKRLGVVQRAIDVSMVQAARSVVSVYPERRLLLQPNDVLTLHLPGMLPAREGSVWVESSIATTDKRSLFDLLAQELRRDAIFGLCYLAFLLALGLLGSGVLSRRLLDLLEVNAASVRLAA
jgi:hypothetical protein